MAGILFHKRIDRSSTGAISRVNQPYVHSFNTGVYSLLTKTRVYITITSGNSFIPSDKIILGLHTYNIAIGKPDTVPIQTKEVYCLGSAIFERTNTGGYDDYYIETDLNWVVAKNTIYCLSLDVSNTQLIVQMITKFRNYTPTGQTLGTVNLINSWCYFLGDWSSDISFRFETLLYGTIIPGWCGLNPVLMKVMCY